MTNGYQDIENAARESAGRTFATLDALARGWSSLADELGSYSAHAVKDGAAHVDKLLGAQTLDAALDAQARYLRLSSARVVGQAARLGEVWFGAMSEAARPFQQRSRPPRA